MGSIRFDINNHIIIDAHNISSIVIIRFFLFLIFDFGMIARHITDAINNHNIINSRFIFH